MKGKKVQHIWTVFCSKKILDRDSNNISLIDLVEQINIVRSNKEVPGILKIPGNFHLVSRFYKVGQQSSVVKFYVRYRFLDPENKDVVPPFEGPATLEKGKKNFRLDTEIGALRFTSPGQYQFLVGMKEEGAKSFEEVAKVPFDLNFQVKK